MSRNLKSYFKDTEHRELYDLYTIFWINITLQVNCSELWLDS